MPQFASLSEMLNLATGGSVQQHLYVGHKQATIAGATYAQTYGGWLDAWTIDGRTPPGTTPGTVAAPTSATQGAIEYTNATSGYTKYLIEFNAFIESDAHGQMVLYDRLLHIGGLSSTVTTAQTVGGSITRNTGGVGNEIWLVNYGTGGATPQTITASYTNQAGTSGRTTLPIRWRASQASTGADLFTVGLPLQAGDSGVQSVQSVTLSGSTGTAGNFGVVIARPLAIAQGSLYYVSGGRGQTSLIQNVHRPIALADDMCLSVAVSTVDSGEDDITFSLYTLEKAN